jgi:hypothetical protein
VNKPQPLATRTAAGVAPVSLDDRKRRPLATAQAMTMKFGLQAAYTGSESTAASKKTADTPWIDSAPNQFL